MTRDSHPVLLTRDELRFEILRGFQQIRQADRRAASLKDQRKAERGWEAMVDTVLARFDDLQVYRREGLGHPSAAQNVPPGATVGSPAAR